MEAVGNLRAGTKIKSARRTIGESDFAAMVNLSWETGPLHSDREYAKTTIFGDLVLGGPCIIPFAAGLSSQARHGMWDRAGAKLIALVGIDHVRFTAPLHPGDTIWVETEILGFRRTSKSDRIIATIKDVVHKVGGDPILEMERVVLLQEKST